MGLRLGASSSSPKMGRGFAGSHACRMTGAGGGGGGLLVRHRGDTRERRRVESTCFVQGECDEAGRSKSSSFYELEFRFVRDARPRPRRFFFCLSLPSSTHHHDHTRAARASSPSRPRSRSVPGDASHRRNSVRK